MDMSAHLSALAVDAGGTRCRIAAATGEGVVSREAGSANVSTDFDGAIAEIRGVLASLAVRLRVSEAELFEVPAFVGMAGVTGPEIADRVRSALPFRRLRVEDDRPAAVRGALGGRSGVVAHCGTGSFFGVQRNDDMRLAGGWGSVLGDEASAQWVGRAALGLTLEAVDGRLRPSALTEMLLSDFGSPAEIVRFAGTARPTDFGALAPRVTELASNGDPVARRIMTDGANEISRSLKLLGWEAGLVLCLTGGIGPQYLPYLPDDLSACASPPEGDPLDGALQLARDFASEVEHDRG